VIPEVCNISTGHLNWAPALRKRDPEAVEERTAHPRVIHEAAGVSGDAMMSLALKVLSLAFHPLSHRLYLPHYYNIKL